MKKQGRMTNARLVPAVAGVICLLAACDVADTPQEYDYVTVCVENKGNTDPSDDVRLDDDDPRCPDALNDAGQPIWDDDEDGEDDWGHDWGGSFVFISTSSGYQVPAVGQRVTYPYGVTPYRPTAAASSATYGSKVIPKAGTTGSITRGGFGVSSSGSSGG